MGKGILAGILILSIFSLIPLAIYDMVYIIPRAAERANQYCKDEGFDFYDKYERIGLFSKEPVAIRCKYVEQYRNVDLNINKKDMGE